MSLKTSGAAGPGRSANAKNLKVMSKRLYDIPSFGEYQPMPSSLKHSLYPGYMRELKTTERWVRQWSPEAGIGHSSIRTDLYVCAD